MPQGVGIMKTSRFSFFQTSADYQGTLREAMIAYEKEFPTRQALQATYRCASPGDENGNRWIEVEIVWAEIG